MTVSNARLAEYDAMIQAEIDGDDADYIEYKADIDTEWQKQELWAENGGYASGVARPAFRFAA